MQIVVSLILVGLVGWCCVALFVRRAEVVIRWSKGGARYRGAFPKSRRHELESFLQREFAEARLTIRGARSRGAKMSWTIRGQATPGQCQQIRNFLHNSD